MNCKVVTQEKIVERYSAAQLNEADTEAFEQHFFECEDCYRALQDHAAIRAALLPLEREFFRSFFIVETTAPGWRAFRFGFSNAAIII